MAENRPSDSPETRQLDRALFLGTYHGYRRRYIRRYLDEFVWRFNRQHYRPATSHLILGLALNTKPMPLPKIQSDPIDDKDIIPALPPPPPTTLPNNALTQAQTRAYKRRGFMLPSQTR